NGKKSNGADNDDDKEIVPNTTTGASNAVMFDEDMVISGINYQDHQVYFKTTAGLSSEGSGIVASNVPTIRNLSGDNVVAFDVGSEKFRKIQISESGFGNSPSDPVPFLDRCHLLEVNGCVAILRRNTADTANLWVYEDSDKESTYKATSMDSTDKNWTKHTITLPVRWVEECDFYFHSASGANQIIMETHLMNSDGRSKAVSIYSYDLEKKLFKKIQIRGIPLSVPVCFDTRMCISFCENLLSLSEA
ncbi:hypothetical protein MKW98_004111, partial [Papaver atlanticum]